MYQTHSLIPIRWIIQRHELLEYTLVRIEIGAQRIDSMNGRCGMDMQEDVAIISLYADLLVCIMGQVPRICSERSINQISNATSGS